MKSQPYGIMKRKYRHFVEVQSLYMENIHISIAFTAFKGV
jgi:hypothetical protein